MTNLQLTHIKQLVHIGRRRMMSIYENDTWFGNKICKYDASNKGANGNIKECHLFGPLCRCV